MNIAYFGNRDYCSLLQKKIDTSFNIKYYDDAVPFFKNKKEQCVDYFYIQIEQKPNLVELKGIDYAIDFRTLLNRSEPILFTSFLSEDYLYNNCCLERLLLLENNSHNFLRLPLIISELEKVIIRSNHIRTMTPMKNILADKGYFIKIIQQLNDGHTEPNVRKLILNCLKRFEIKI